MHDEGFEGAGWTFDDGLVPFDKVEYLHAVRMMRNGHREPVAAGLDEFIFVQTRSLFAPAFAFGHQLYLIDEVLTDKIRLAFPLDDVRTVSDVDRTGQTVEAEASPVVEFEGKDAGRRTDFQNHRAGTRAMDCAVRDEEMVVLLGRPAIYETLGIEGFARFLRFV